MEVKDLNPLAFGKFSTRSQKCLVLLAISTKFVNGWLVLQRKTILSARLMK